MAKREARITVLDEDRQHHAFVNRLLKGLGFEGRKIFLIDPPADKSGGFGHVLERYPDEVREHRRKSKFQTSLRLVVVIDADDGDVDERLKELDKRLQADEQPKRGEDEGIVILVPKRNIETWIHWLEGNPVDEEKEYSKYHRGERSCQGAVENLVKLIRSGKGLPADCPSSLHRAIAEMKKLHP